MSPRERVERLIEALKPFRREGVKREDIRTVLDEFGIPRGERFLILAALFAKESK